jgi:hypothetical protein
MAGLVPAIHGLPLPDGEQALVAQNDKAGEFQLVESYHCDTGHSRAAFR